MSTNHSQGCRPHCVSPDTNIKQNSFCPVLPSQLPTCISLSRLSCSPISPSFLPYSIKPLLLSPCDLPAVYSLCWLWHAFIPRSPLAHLIVMLYFIISLSTPLSSHLSWLISSCKAFLHSLSSIFHIKTHLKPCAKGSMSNNDYSAVFVSE